MSDLFGRLDKRANHPDYPGHFSGAIWQRRQPLDAPFQFANCAFSNLVTTSSIALCVVCEEGIMTSSDEKHEYQLEEYRSLRDEIKLKLEQKFMVERASIIGVGIIYGAAGTLNVTNLNGDVKPFAWIIWWAAPAILLLSIISTYVNDAGIELAARYIREKIEIRFEGGWESFIEHESRPYVHLYRFSFKVIFCCTIAVSLFTTYMHFFSATSSAK